MLLVLTADDDLHADAVCARLRERELPHRRFDPADFGVRASVAAAFGGEGSGVTIGYGDGRLDLDEVTCVWWRRPGHPGGDDAAGAEWRATSVDLLDTLDRPSVLLLPGPYPVVDRAQHKMRQLRMAAELGFEVPATLVTNEPDAVLDFAGRHERVVTKRVAPGLPFLTADGVEAFRYTEVLRPVDLLNVDAVRLCPVALQEYVPKRLELRVTVIGERVFAAAIDSQGTHHTRDDWRRYDEAHTAVVAFPEFPADLAARCVALTRAFGIRYGAIDFVLTPDGRYVFLEINPSGQYLWIEWLTGMPLTETIVDLFAERLVHA